MVHSNLPSNSKIANSNQNWLLSVESRHQFVRNVSGHLAGETKLWRCLSRMVGRLTKTWRDENTSKKRKQPFIYIYIYLYHLSKWHDFWSRFVWGVFGIQKSCRYNAIDGAGGSKGSNLEQLRTSLVDGLKCLHQILVSTNLKIPAIGWESEFLVPTSCLNYLLPSTELNMSHRKSSSNMLW